MRRSKRRPRQDRAVFRPLDKRFRLRDDLVPRRGLQKGRDVVLILRPCVVARLDDLRLRLRLRVPDHLLKKRVLLRASRRATLRFHKLFARRRLALAVRAILARIVRVKHKIPVFLRIRDVLQLLIRPRLRDVRRVRMFRRLVKGGLEVEILVDLIPNRAVWEVLHQLWRLVRIRLEIVRGVLAHRRVGVVVFVFVLLRVL